MIPPLLSDDHPLLAKEMPRFDFKSEDARDVATTLIEAMTYYEGFGLAANQIGIEKAVFAMETLDQGPIVLFNPMITWLSMESALIEEGCLSFPRLALKVKRPAECQVSYQNEFGVTEVRNFKGIEARCAQHEMDHLLGIVFTAKVSRLKLDLARKKANKRRK